MNYEMIELLDEYNRVSQMLTTKKNEFIRCKNKQDMLRIEKDIYILELLYDDVSNKLDRM